MEGPGTHYAAGNLSRRKRGEGVMRTKKSFLVDDVTNEMMESGLNPTHFVVSKDGTWEYRGPASENAKEILRRISSRWMLRPNHNAIRKGGIAYMVSCPMAEQREWSDYSLEFWYVGALASRISQGRGDSKEDLEAVVNRVKELSCAAQARHRARYLVCHDCDAPSVVVLRQSISPDYAFCGEHIPARFKARSGGPNYNASAPVWWGDGDRVGLCPIEKYHPEVEETELVPGFSWLEYGEIQQYDELACLYYGDTQLTRAIVARAADPDRSGNTPEGAARRAKQFAQLAGISEEAAPPSA